MLPAAACAPQGHCGSRRAPLPRHHRRCPPCSPQQQPCRHLRAGFSSWHRAWQAARGSGTPTHVLRGARSRGDTARKGHRTLGEGRATFTLPLEGTGLAWSTRGLPGLFPLCPWYTPGCFLSQQKPQGTLVQSCGLMAGFGVLVGDSRVRQPAPFSSLVLISD